MGKNRYDHRLRNAIASSKNPNLFPEIKIPRSTTAEWIRLGIYEVITHPSLNMSPFALVEENAKLRLELAKEKTKRSLISVSIQITGFKMQYLRIETSELKKKLLDTIETAKKVIPLKECLKIIGLSTARYFSWLKRQVQCLLQDQSSCPRLSPTKLTSKEIAIIKDLVTAKEFAHFSITSLAMFAKRESKVFASATAWFRIIHKYKLRRSTIRIYPSKPKIGVRAKFPNQIWHLDQSVFRLINGTKVFIQAIIDNFSRYILAWQVTDTHGGASTRGLINNALNVANTIQGKSIIPNVFVDSGTENINSDVDLLINSGRILRTIAQIDIEFSNSMIEVFFRSLKHKWLFKVHLTSKNDVEQEVNKYCHQHNNIIPHHALTGATPLEVFSGQWTEKSFFDIIVATITARTNRLKYNQSLICGICPI